MEQERVPEVGPAKVPPWWRPDRHASLARRPVSVLSALACLCVAVLLAQSLAAGTFAPLRFAPPAAPTPAPGQVAASHYKPGEILPWDLSLQSVVMRSPSDGWATGAIVNTTGPGPHGLLLHWDGTSWRRVAGPRFENAAVLSVLPNGEIWAAGDQKVVRYVNGAWEVQADFTNTLPSFSISAFAMVSPDDGWLAGNTNGPDYSEAVLLHLQNGTWRTVGLGDSAKNLQIFGFSMYSKDEGWAVGHQASVSWMPVVLHYMDGHWTRATAQYDGATLLSISAAGPGEAWAVGYGGPMEGITLHCMQERCARVEMPTSNILTVVAMRSPTDGWIGGHGAATLHYDGRNWTKVGVVIHGEVLSGIAMTSATEGWATGWMAAGDSMDSAPLLRYHNGVWQPYELHIPESDTNG